MEISEVNNTYVIVKNAAGILFMYNIDTIVIFIFAVASSYSDQAKFSSNKGSMNLRNIHNESYVAVYDQGDVKIQGLDGSTNIFIKKFEKRIGDELKHFSGAIEPNKFSP